MATETFNATATWKAPAGVHSVKVQCWGGGGASRHASGGGDWGGGGGGAFSQANAVTVIPGVNYTVNVGDGGDAGYNPGQDGVDTYFISATTVMAKGGDGSATATGAYGGSASDSVGDTKYAGGNGGNGVSGQGGGGGGGSGGLTSAGGNGGNASSGTGGAAGAAGSGSPGGAVGGAGGNDGSGANAGVAPGGGAGGSGTNFASAGGANGRVILIYEVSTGSGGPIYVS
jgi:hypothetical protein